MYISFKTLIVCLALAPISLFAAEEENEKETESEFRLLDISLQELMNVKVRTATKKSQQLSETPAIVSVITRKDIMNWGYQSVGEALKQVPGLYNVNDYVGYNYGIRGINGGQRGYSKIMKLMINGAAIPFRADLTNFLGPELIPVEAIERIEVIRGPGSALYGENAFLGVINVITREIANTEREISAKLGNHEFGSISGRFAEKGDDWSFSVNAGTTRYNYDGSRLPSSSPSFQFIDDKIAHNADVTPASLYIDFNYKKQNLKHHFQYGYSLKDSVAEFLDFGTLSHENRVALTQSLLNYQLSWQYSDSTDLKYSFSYSNGKPSSKERLSLGETDSIPVREFEFNTFETSVELHHTFESGSSYIAGIDYVNDDEELIQIFSLDLNSGSLTQISEPRENVKLKNVGVYFQWQQPISEAQLLTLNARNDDHNIYGSNGNFRFGYVLKSSKDVTAKILLGTSYKAPAAMQLYAQPIYPGEVIGNEELKPEEATTLESEILWNINKELAFNLNVWKTEVKNKVELQPFGPNIQPQNTGKQNGVGLETELKWIYQQGALIANLAYQEMEDEIELIFQPTRVSPTSMYPKLSSFIRYRTFIDDSSSWGVNLFYASERRATNSNIRENLLRPYQLDSYYLIGLSYTKKWNNISLNFKVNNAFDEKYSEPGFQGIDVPGRSRQVSLGVTYEID